MRSLEVVVEKVVVSFETVLPGEETMFGRYGLTSQLKFNCDGDNGRFENPVV